MLDYTHLQALLAVEKNGSFEAAAKELGMTSIGVATRVRKLEARMGVPLLTRKPTRPTPAGEALCKHASEVVRLEQNVLDDQRANALQPSSNAQTLKIAVSCHSQIDWFSEAFDTPGVGNERPSLFDISIIDADHSIEPMRNGKVIAAMSSHKQPVHGYKSFKIGTITHRAVASPGFMQQFFKDGVTIDAISRARCIRRTAQDDLCQQWVQHVFGSTAALTSFRQQALPNVIELSVSGAGWVVLPETVVADELTAGTLVELVEDAILVKNLYWNVAEAMVDEIAHITAYIRENASL